MSYGIWGSFLSYAFVMAFLPGPNNILLLNATGSRGLAGSRCLLAGVCAGLLGVMFAFGVFGAFLSAYMPNAATFLKYPGAAYILWLAWKIAFPKPREGGEEGSVPAAPGFRQGFVLQFLNPKVILFGLTALSAFVIPWTSSKAWLFGTGLFLALACSSGVTVWTALGAAQKRIMSRQGRAVDLIMGGLLAWCAFSVSGLGNIIFR